MLQLPHHSIFLPKQTEQALHEARSSLRIAVCSRHPLEMLGFCLTCWVLWVFPMQVEQVGVARMEVISHSPHQELLLVAV